MSAGLTNVFLKLLTTPSIGYSGNLLGLGKGLNFPIVSVLSPTAISPTGATISNGLCTTIDLCLNSSATSLIYFMQGGGIYFSSSLYTSLNRPSPLLTKNTTSTTPTPTPTPTTFTNSLKNSIIGSNIVGQYWISSDGLFLLYRYSAPSTNPTRPSGYYILYNAIGNINNSQTLLPNYCAIINNIDTKCSSYITIPPTTTPNSVASTPGSVNTTPSGVASTPGGVNTTPNSVASTPGGVNTTPNNITTPNSVNTTPNRVNTTPNSVASTPGSVNTTPNNVNTTPNSVNTTPNSVASTLGSVNTTPNNVTTTPNNVTTTPNNVTSTPGSVNTTPNNVNTTTNNVASTPGSVNTTPSVNITPNIISSATSQAIIFFQAHMVEIILSFFILFLLAVFILKK